MSCSFSSERSIRPSEVERVLNNHITSTRPILFPFPYDAIDENLARQNCATIRQTHDGPRPGALGENPRTGDNGSRCVARNGRRAGPSARPQLPEGGMV